MTSDPSQNTSPNQDVQNLFNDLEKDLTDHIIFNISHRKISTDEAQKLAQEFLALLPAKDKEDLLGKLNVLSKKYNETKEVYAKYAASYDSEQSNKKIQQMLQHIKTGDIEKAISVAKGTNQ